jgi:hypothetical protein
VAVSSRTLALGTAGIVAGIIAVVTIRALRDGAASEPPAAASAYKPAPPPSQPPAPLGSVPKASAEPSAATVSSSFARVDLDGGTQSYDLEEHVGGQTFGPKVRPIDREIFDFIAKGQAKPGMSDDVFPKKPYRVKTLRIGQNGLVVKVWVDLNRNGKWDERWDLTADQVDRHIDTDDGENYDTDLRLRNGHWLPY